MSNVSNNWCPDVYRGLFVDRFNDDQLRVSPCCQARPSRVPVKNFNFDTDSFLTEIRQSFNKGIKHNACKICWHDEDNGKKSRRLSQIEFYNIKPDTQVRLESLDYHSTWACNLACVQCGPNNSSLWASEINWTTDTLEQNGRRFRKLNNVLDLVDKTALKRMHFNGGEPLLNNEHHSVLDQLDLSNIVVSYNTNGTVYPSDELIKIWARAKLVKLFFSIDATGPAFEYVRWPASWIQVTDNLLKMRKELPSNVMFSFNLTIGAYNALDLAPLWDWFSQNIATNREGDPSDFCHQIAYNFDPSWLTPDAKHAIISDISSIDTLTVFANYIKSTLDDTPTTKWIDKLDAIDQRRGTNWRESLNIGKYYKC